MIALRNAAQARALDQAAAIVDWANTASLNVAIRKDRDRELWFIQTIEILHPVC